MKKVLSLVALAMISTIMFAVNDGAKTNQNKKEAKFLWMLTLIQMNCWMLFLG